MGRAEEGGKQGTLRNKPPYLPCARSWSCAHGRAARVAAPALSWEAALTAQLGASTLLTMNDALAGLDCQRRHRRQRGHGRPCLTGGQLLSRRKQMPASSQRYVSRLRPETDRWAWLGCRGWGPHTRSVCASRASPNSLGEDTEETKHVPGPSRAIAPTQPPGEVCRPSPSVLPGTPWAQLSSRAHRQAQNDLPRWKALPRPAGEEARAPEAPWQSRGHCKGQRSGRSGPGPGLGQGRRSARRHQLLDHVSLCHLSGETLSPPAERNFWKGKLTPLLLLIVGS